MSFVASSDSRPDGLERAPGRLPHLDVGVAEQPAERRLRGRRPDLAERLRGRLAQIREVAPEQPDQVLRAAEAARSRPSASAASFRTCQAPSSSALPRCGAARPCAERPSTMAALTRTRQSGSESSPTRSWTSAVLPRRAERPRARRSRPAAPARRDRAGSGGAPAPTRAAAGRPGRGPPRAAPRDPVAERPFEGRERPRVADLAWSATITEVRTNGLVCLSASMRCVAASAPRISRSAVAAASRTRASSSSSAPIDGGHRAGVAEILEVPERERLAPSDLVADGRDQGVDDLRIREILYLRQRQLARAGVGIPGGYPRDPARAKAVSCRLCRGVAIG